MKVSELMTPEVDFVSSDDTIQKAARKMEDLDVGVLPVIVGKELVGMITDRDITVRVAAQGLDPQKAKVVDAITEGVVACKAEDDVNDVARLMKDKKIRRVAVTDDGGQLAGIVSFADLATSADKTLVGEVIRVISR
jgi:CBS domain-containing protein